MPDRLATSLPLPKPGPEDRSDPRRRPQSSRSAPHRDLSAKYTSLEYGLTESIRWMSDPPPTFRPPSYALIAGDGIRVTGVMLITHSTHENHRRNAAAISAVAAKASSAVHACRRCPSVQADSRASSSALTEAPASAHAIFSSKAATAIP